jgi:hypothetical protein
MRFLDWLSGGWKTTKNEAKKVDNFICKSLPMVGSFISKAARNVYNIRIFMSNLP